jgi:serine/threonine protein kinase
MDLDNAKLIFRDILFALYKLHEQDIAHEDIKPENIMIND